MSSLHRPSRLFILLSLAFVLSIFKVSSTFSQVDGLQGLFVSNITSNSAIIWWSGSEGVSGRVVIEGRSSEDHEPPFEVVVSDLKPGILYPYHVEFADGRRRPSEGTFIFSTVP